MPSTKTYCARGRWIKKALADDIDSIVFDFRDRLKVRKETPASCSPQPTQQQLDARAEQPASVHEAHPSLRTFICPTADPLRTSGSYDLLVELLDRGSLIKEAVRRLKANRRSKQLKRLEPSADNFDDCRFGEWCEERMSIINEEGTCHGHVFWIWIWKAKVGRGWSTCCNCESV